jgi:hypothetical protein
VNGGDTRLVWGELGTEYEDDDEYWGERWRGTRGETANGWPRLAPTYVPCDVGAESGYGSAGRSINGDVALIANEAACSGVKDHNPKELQIAVGVVLHPVREEAGCRLRVNQFRPQVLNFARENFRSLDGQKSWIRSEACCVFCPIGLRSSLSQTNRVWARITGVDREITMIDFLGMEGRKDRKKQSKKKTISLTHKECL